MSQRREKKIRRLERRIVELEGELQMLRVMHGYEKPTKKPGLWQRIKALLIGQ